MDKTQVTSFPAAMLDYFGKKPGQDSKGFMDELKALTSEDRAEFKALLAKHGYRFE